MKVKDLLKNKQVFFLIILAALLGLTFLSQFFLPKKITTKSKAEEIIPLIFEPSSVTAANGTDFTLTIKMAPSNPVTIQLFKINLNFDKNKVNVKNNGINYSVGQPSANLGADDNSAVGRANNTGTVKLYSEITNPTTGLIVNGETELAKVTFTSKSGENYSITNSNSSIIKINADYTVASVLLSNATLTVNGGGGTTSTPTPTSGAGGNVTLNLKLKFQGITKKPDDQYNRLRVKVVAVSSSGERSEGSADFTASDINDNQKGIWSGTVSLNLTAGSGYKILVKGPKHIQKKVCVTTPTESSPGSYHCGNGQITLAAGANNLDFSGILMLSGDLPEQDGVVNSYDTSLVRNNLGKTDPEALRLADINLDGRVDTQDYSLIIAALSVRADEE